MKMYDGEFIDGETGEEKSFSGTLAEVNRMTHNMRDGDALVINCHVEDDRTHFLPQFLKTD